MQYLVRVTEELTHAVVVEADSMQDAENKVNTAYDNCQIVLDYDDFDNYEIDALREATDSDIKYCDILEVEE